MAQKLFIAATGQHSGKTTISLSLLHLARKKYARVGFIKPLGPKPVLLNGIPADKDAALMAQILGHEDWIELMSPLVLQPGDTQKVLRKERDPAQMRTLIVEACAKLERECDFLIIEGAGHCGVGSVLGMSNAKMAKMLDAPVLMISGGGVGNVIDSVHLNLALFEREHADVRALLVNKIVADKRELVLDLLQRGFEDQPFSVLGGFNYQPVLANPTMRRLAKILELEIQGEQESADRIVHHVQVGAASTQRMTELLKDSTLLIVTSSRDELLVTLSVMYQMSEYRSKIAGLLIPGRQAVGKVTQQIIDNSNIPYMRVMDKSTSDLYLQITSDVSKITHEDTEKIDLVHQLAEKRFDFDVIEELFCR
ncbi:MAG: AAA family ATPase [Geobacteraceae bacterium]|nr:AAA family ATPase [Geobacteraceae bacterium]